MAVCDIRDTSQLITCIVIIRPCPLTVGGKQFVSSDIADMCACFVFFCDNLPVRIDKAYQLSGTVVGINMVVLLYQLSKYIIRVPCALNLGKFWFCSWTYNKTLLKKYYASLIGYFFNIFLFCCWHNNNTVSIQQHFNCMR